MHQQHKSIAVRHPANLSSKTGRVERQASSSHVRQRRQTASVKQLQPRQVPKWLRSLIAMQRVAMVLFLGSFGLSSLVYGYTVSTQGMWKTQHRQLQKLQKQELQQATVSENFKYQIAQTAELPESGLVDPKPDRMVTISTANQRQTKLPAISTPAKPEAVSKIPEGY